MWPWSKKKGRAAVPTTRAAKHIRAGITSAQLELQVIELTGRPWGRHLSVDTPHVTILAHERTYSNGYRKAMATWREFRKTLY